MEGPYVAYFGDDKLDIDNKPIIYNDGEYPRTGRSSGKITVFIGLLAIILLAVTLGFVAQTSSALSSWTQHQKRKEHEILTSTVPEIQARGNNTAENKTEISGCSLGWLEVNRKCYYISAKGKPKSWSDSRTDCETRGGRLVTVKTKTQLRALGWFHDRAWIGLSNRDSAGLWMWEDGTNLTLPTFWVKDGPSDYSDNKDCVHLTAIGKQLGFNDNPCVLSLPYICETLR